MSIVDMGMHKCLLSSSSPCIYFIKLLCGIMLFMHFKAKKKQEIIIKIEKNKGNISWLLKTSD